MSKKSITWNSSLRMIGRNANHQTTEYSNCWLVLPSNKWDVDREKLLCTYGILRSAAMGGHRFESQDFFHFRFPRVSSAKAMSGFLKTKESNQIMGKSNGTTTFFFKPWILRCPQQIRQTHMYVYTHVYI